MLRHMRECALGQRLQVHVSSYTKTIQSSDWPKRSCMFGCYGNLHLLSEYQTSFHAFSRYLNCGRCFINIYPANWLKWPSLLPSYLTATATQLWRVSVTEATTALPAWTCPTQPSTHVHKVRLHLQCRHYITKTYLNWFYIWYTRVVGLSACNAIKLK